MPGGWLGYVGLALLVIVGAAFCLRPLLEWMQRREAKRGMEQFRIQREHLEAKFFDRAASLGKPRGLRWLRCDWLGDVAFARDLDSGLLTAFVGVNIRFEAIEGEDMEDVAAVDTIRDAAAVFHYHRGVWGTGGRALFNMGPDDAVARLKSQFSPVATPQESRTV